MNEHKKNPFEHLRLALEICQDNNFSQDTRSMVYIQNLHFLDWLCEQYQKAEAKQQEIAA